MRKSILTILVILVATYLAWGCSATESQPYEKPVNAAADPWQETFEPGEYPLVTGPRKFHDQGPQTARSRKFPISRALNLQTNHENGAQVQLSGITLDQTRTSLEAVIINGSEVDIELNSLGKELVLVDSQSNVYQLVPPTHNKKLHIKARETVKASLNFSGRLHPDADSVTLVTNDLTGEVEGRESTRPKFMLHIPLGGVI